MMHSIGNRLRILREAKGMTQDDLAEAAGMNRVTIAKYETGRIEPKTKSLSRLAAALGVTTDYLIGQVEPENEQEQIIAPRTIEARIVSFGMDSLPKEEREKILAILQTMYSNKPDLFKEDNAHDA